MDRPIRVPLPSSEGKELVPYLPRRGVVYGRGVYNDSFLRRRLIYMLKSGGTGRAPRDLSLIHI